MSSSSAVSIHASTVASSTTRHELVSLGLGGEGEHHIRYALVHGRDLNATVTQNSHIRRSVGRVTQHDVAFKHV